MKLEIGALTLLADEQIRFWVEALAARDGHPGVTVEIAHLPGRVHCSACGADSELPPPEDTGDHFSLPRLACPVCGAQEVTIIGGREVRVVSARIDGASNAHQS